MIEVSVGILKIIDEADDPLAHPFGKKLGVVSARPLGNTEGIYKLLKNGASIVTNAQDVLNALNWEIQSSTKPVQNNDFDNLTVDEKKILYTINIEPKTFDEIQKETQIDTETLLELLTTLELNSIITQTADNRYRKE